MKNNKILINLFVALLLTILFSFIYIQKSQIPLHCTLVKHYDFLNYKGETHAVNQVETIDLIIIIDSFSKKILDNKKAPLGFVFGNVNRNEIYFKTMYEPNMEDTININRNTGAIEGYGRISDSNGELSFTYSGKCEPYKVNKKF